MSEDNALASVIQELETAAAAGQPGDRLPSVRELMRRHRVAPATVQRAIGSLAARGLVEARPGRGTFVAPSAPRRRRRPTCRGRPWRWGAARRTRARSTTLLRPRHPGRSCCRPATCRPSCSRSARSGRRWRAPRGGPGVWDRMPLEGLASLRAYFAAAVGGGASAGDVLICPGGQAGAVACLRGLAAPGAPVLVEAPTYLGALVAARARRAAPGAGARSDERGIRPDLLADALARSRARRRSTCQPLFANPHGATLAPERRAAVLEAVRAAGAFLVEDDAFRELAFGPGPAAAVRRRPRRPRRAPALADQAGRARAADRRRCSPAARRRRASEPPASSRTSSSRARSRRRRSSSSARPAGAPPATRPRRAARAAGRARGGGRPHLGPAGSRCARAAACTSGSRSTTTRTTSSWPPGPPPRGRDRLGGPPLVRRRAAAPAPAAHLRDRAARAPGRGDADPRPRAREVTRAGRARSDPRRPRPMHETSG